MRAPEFAWSAEGTGELNERLGLHAGSQQRILRLLESAPGGFWDVRSLEAAMADLVLFPNAQAEVNELVKPYVRAVRENLNTSIVDGDKGFLMRALRVFRVFCSEDPIPQPEKVKKYLNQLIHAVEGAPEDETSIEVDAITALVDWETFFPDEPQKIPPRIQAWIDTISPEMLEATDDTSLISFGVLLTKLDPQLREKIRPEVLRREEKIKNTIRALESQSTSGGPILWEISLAEFKLMLAEEVTRLPNGELRAVEGILPKKAGLPARTVV